MFQACRLIGKKGLDVSLQTVARLVRQGKDVTLDLAGAGPEEPLLRALAQELGIAAQVRFLGFVENAALLRALPDYDVFIHPSRTTASGDREGIPNSLLEAMACGVPVVATRHSGIPEAVTHEESGLLIDAAEPEALARALEALLDHPALYARISQAARETVAARFSIAACAQKLETSYYEAMALARQNRMRPAA
jgi:glycosyltransferase involved in cell wall biosynthesis